MDFDFSNRGNWLRFRRVGIFKRRKRFSRVRLTVCWQSYLKIVSFHSSTPRAERKRPGYSSGAQLSVISRKRCGVVLHLGQNNPWRPFLHLSLQVRWLRNRWVRSNRLLSHQSRNISVMSTPTERHNEARHRMSGDNIHLKIEQPAVQLDRCACSFDASHMKAPCAKNAGSTITKNAMVGLAHFGCDVQRACLLDLSSTLRAVLPPSG